MAKEKYSDAEVAAVFGYTLEDLTKRIEEYLKKHPEATLEEIKAAFWAEDTSELDRPWA